MDELRTAAQDFVNSYSEHLNHHCARCTSAWEKLRDALEPAPSVMAAAALDTKIEGEFRASMGDRREGRSKG